MPDPCRLDDRQHVSRRDRAKVLGNTKASFGHNFVDACDGRTIKRLKGDARDGTLDR
jgi:hypothetical protein